ncbi:MAG: dihydrofolate synthase, partial [Prochlorococcus sp.]|nr:dihydrofolate synthase [Prochlorococcus sp.]
MNDREWLTQRQFAGMSLGLERIEPLLERLGDPQLKFPSIHVAGTNGKGSLCALLSSAACDSGFKTGLFTTPHLVTVEERIRIDGKPISPEEFDNYLNRIRMASEVLAAEGGQEPTFYEATFAIAMLAFSDLDVQRGIIETGMGGAGDATRLVDADLCVITTISLDHTEVLGPTLADIAQAKIGIHRE